jgi:hypothetical protein
MYLLHSETLLGELSIDGCKESLPFFACLAEWGGGGTYPGLSQKGEYCHLGEKRSGLMRGRGGTPLVLAESIHFYV